MKTALNWFAGLLTTMVLLGCATSKEDFEQMSLTERQAAVCYGSDTFEQGKQLHGIDTPERDQPYGKQATRALDALIKTKVFVEEKDTDRYGRLVGVLFTAEGLNVNLEMVCSGHAWWYERYARFDSDLED